MLCRQLYQFNDLHYIFSWYGVLTTDFITKITFVKLTFRVDFLLCFPATCCKSPFLGSSLSKGSVVFLNVNVFS